MSRDAPAILLLSALGVIFLLVATGAVEFGSPWPELPPGVDRAVSTDRVEPRGATDVGVARVGARAAAEMSVPELAGQRIVGSFRGATAPPPPFAAGIRAGRIGGVVLFEDNVPEPTPAAYRALADRLQAIAAAAGRPPLLVATDQESALVARVSGPPGLRARAIGRLLGRRIRRLGMHTGRLLRKAGIQVDLAPVADVPSGPESFIADRAYATDWRTVARAARSFATGLQAAGVAATAKHYPGLGAARTSTDLGPVHLRRDGRLAREDLAPFEALVRAGVPLVMVSSASYSAGGLPAVLTPAAIRRLRRLGFEGTVVSDALDTPALERFGDEVAVRAARAGVDLLLWANGDGHRAFDALVADAGRDRGGVAAMRAAAARVLALKETLARCRSYLQPCPLRAEVVDRGLADSAPASP